MSVWLRWITAMVKYLTSCCLVQLNDHKWKFEVMYQQCNMLKTLSVALSVSSCHISIFCFINVEGALQPYALFPHLSNLKHWRAVSVNSCFIRWCFEKQPVPEHPVLRVQGRRSGLGGNTCRNILCSLQACRKVLNSLNSSCIAECDFFQLWWHFRSGVFMPTEKLLWILFN